MGISADGSTAVGFSYDGIQIPFRWTATAGMQDLGFNAPDTCTCSSAIAVDADGSVVAGLYRGKAFRWDNGAIQMLGFLDGRVSGFSVANGVSADGSVVVGRSDSALGVEAFRWVDGAVPQMQNLGNLGAANSQASGVSGDGSIVVCYSYRSDGNLEAFRWEEGHGPMQGLGFLDGTGTYLVSVATAKACAQSPIFSPKAGSISATGF
jgi:probable HAF family extracellular repeat protein